ncbi:MAG: pyrroline-5-carboxylate reductase [Candidatus Margulisbacteria bacterium]|nr:pyrroline-5-carboxylate reductase [Candidatus Margulisiibacteriota bacterium]
MTTIGFIGGGKMAEAIIKGLLSSKIVEPHDICAFDIAGSRLNQLFKAFRISADLKDNQQVLANSQTVILAVKPQDMDTVLAGLEISADKLVISIAAGITLAYLEKKFPGLPVVRVMPNNPALVQAGISAIAAGKNAKREHLEQAKKIFGAVGQVVEVDEKLMDAITGLSGSGPAFVYLVIEALAKAGEDLGIDKKEAEKLAIGTVMGAAQTMLQTGKSASELREMVASPGGTTIAGLKVLEEKKFFAALVEAVKAAAERSKKLSK